MASTREALIDAGVALMADRGFDAVTIGDIEAHAGFTRRGGTLYRHFRSKHELLHAAVLLYVDSLADQEGLTDLLPLPDLDSELRVIGRWILRRLDREEAISRLIEKEAARLADIIETMRDGVSEPGYRRLAEFLVARGLRDDAEATAMAVMLLGGLINLRRSTWTFGKAPADVDDEAAIDAWTALCRSVLRSSDEVSVRSTVAP